MGVLRNYAPLDDISNRITIPALIFATFTPLFVLARCVCGKIQTGKLWADDYLLIASATIAFSGAVLMAVSSSWAFGKHERDLHTYPAEKLPFGNGQIVIEKTLQLYFIGQVLYQVVIGLIGVSLLTWYTRIFATSNKKKFRLVCWWLVGVIVVFTFASTFAAIFQCDPLNVAWQSRPAKCINLEAHWEARASFNIAISFIVTLLPMPSIWGIPRFVDGLQMEKPRMVGLCALFGIGIFTSITAIIRVQSISLAAVRRDRTWNSIDLIMWSLIENNVSIICACLPAMARQTHSLLRILCCWTEDSRRSSSAGDLLPRPAPDEKMRGGASRTTTVSSRQSVVLEV